MPRNQRTDVGGIIYHVINRANARMRIFNEPKDYQLFEATLQEAKEQVPMRILSCCIMSNHWHLALYPKKDNDLQKFMGWFTLTHTRRRHVAHKTIGSGHLYQGRYKSFPVQSNEYFIHLCEYVERNALRAKLVRKSVPDPVIVIPLSVILDVLSQFFGNLSHSYITTLSTIALLLNMEI